MDAFLARHGLAAAPKSDHASSSGFADVGRIDAVPHIGPTGREGYRKFLAADLPRAFALSPAGGWAWRSGPAAPDDALTLCQKHSRLPCRLYAVDDAVVWTPQTSEARP
jgi:hypothetical protein